MPDTKTEESKKDKENISNPKGNSRVVCMSSVDTSNHKDDWLGNLVGQAILPAQLTRKNEGSFISVVNELVSNKNTHFEYERFTVALNDGTKLDTTEIKHTLDPHNKGYMIFFPGNDVNYTQLTTEVLDDVSNFNCVYFNYRGVGNSVGKACASQDLINDGIAQVERLIAAGTPPSLIYLYGYSLGGGVSTLVYEHFQKKGIYLGYCFNDRSFNNLETASPDSIAYITNIAQLSSMSNSVINSIITAATKKGISQTNWSLNPAPAFANIPPDRKGGACVHWQNKNNLVGGDGIISDVAMMKDSQIKQYEYSRKLAGHIAPYDWLHDDQGKNPRENFYEACKQIRSRYLDAYDMYVTLGKKYEELLTFIKSEDNISSLEEQIHIINELTKQTNEYEDMLQQNHFNDLIIQTNSLRKNLYSLISDPKFVNKISQLSLSSENFDELTDVIMLHEFLVKNLNNNPNLSELSSKLEQLLIDKSFPIMKETLSNLFNDNEKNYIDNFGVNIFYILGIITDRMENDQTYHDLFLQVQKLSQQYAKQYTKYQEKLIASIMYPLTDAEQKLNDIKHNSHTLSAIELQNKFFEAKHYLDRAKTIASTLISNRDHHPDVINNLMYCDNLYTELKNVLKIRIKHEVNDMYPDKVTLESIETIAKEKNKTSEIKNILHNLQIHLENYTSAIVNNNTEDMISISKLIATSYFDINKNLQLDRKNKAEYRLSDNLKLKCLYYMWNTHLDNILHVIPDDASVYNMVNQAKDNLRLHAAYNLKSNMRIEIAQSLVDLHDDILSHLEKLSLDEHQHNKIVETIESQRNDLIDQNQLSVARSSSSLQQNEMPKLHLNDRISQKPQRSPRPEPEVEAKQQKTH